MLDTLQQLDSDLFLALNHATCEWLDNFMWYFSGKWVWAFLYAAILWSFFYRYGWKRALGLVLLMALIITVTDQLSGHWVRYAVARLRPSNLENPLSPMVHIVNGYRGGPYSFPSSHAANAFALATFLSLLMRSRAETLSMFLWAIVTAYSRIVLGVHYPGDLMVGAAAGSAVAAAAYYSARAIYRRYPHDEVRPSRLPVMVVTGMLWAIVLVMAIVAFC